MRRPRTTLTLMRRPRATLTFKKRRTLVYPMPDTPPQYQQTPSQPKVSPAHPSEAQEEEEEPPFAPDDPATVREQNLRALLVLLPAKVMDGVVKEAMERAMLHTRRTATADAERQRRSLLLSRAQFRHTRTQSSKEVRYIYTRYIYIPIWSWYILCSFGTLFSSSHVMFVCSLS